MLINVKKSGMWAFKGIFVEELKKGLHEFTDSKAEELIYYGRAELAEEKTTSNKIIESTDLKNTTTKYILESAEKNSGWWTIKFEGVENNCKVRGKSEDEAVANAIAELEEM